MRIAIPITASTIDDVLKDLDRITKIAEKDKENDYLAELRIDYIENIQLSDLKTLLKHSPIEKIVTNRHKSESGSDPWAGFKGTEKQRIAYLQEAIEFGAEYVDIEAHYFHKLKKKETKLIVSYHNFEETPQDLEEKYDDIANEMSTDIIKIATKAQNYGDSLRMLNLIANAKRKDDNRDIIGICMGEEGIITRVLGPVYGSYLTFASLGEGKSSAPGQLSVDELRKAWKDLQITKT